MERCHSHKSTQKLSTQVGAFTTYKKMTTLQKAHFRATRNHRETYIKLVERDFRSLIQASTYLKQQECESAVQLLNLVFQTHQGRSLPHKKVFCFVIYYAIKRTRDPDLSQIAELFQLDKYKIAKSVKEMRKIVSIKPEFDFLSHF